MYYFKGGKPYMFNNSNGYSLSDIAAATGNNGNNNGLFNGDGAWIFFLFILMLAGGWNNGFGGNGNGAVQPIMADFQRGFDQNAVISGINGLTTAVNTGFFIA